MSRGSSLTHRLVAAQVLVVGAMTLAMTASALLVGPAVFDRHYHQAHTEGGDLYAHAAEAFRTAGGVSLATGLVIAVVTALLVGVLLARRIGASLDALTEGASRVAAGRYDKPVTMPPSVRELESVATMFNAMAAQIADTESTRRRLLTDLSHEMRTPLAAIDVTLEALEDGVRDLDAETFAVLRGQTRRLARLAGDIRDVSAAEEGRLDLHMQPVRVGDLVDAAVSAARPGFDAAGVALHVAPGPAAALTATVDAARIGQVLDNVLRNARQHTPVSGQVTLTTELGDDDVRLVVTDDGAGIAPETLPHLFERFYRADAGRRQDDRGGTGVGLSISRAIATAHGGSLVAASDGPGSGATFTLTLPRT